MTTRVAPCSPQRRPWVLAATILASAMAFIDGSVVTIALPVIRTDLDASLTEMLWVLNAYTLFLGALLMVGGGAGDRLGRRRVFLAGIALFALASLVCALAPNPTVLIAGRALKGIGAALLVPQSLAIISACYPSGERGHAIGLWAGASALTTALGPAVGGILMDLFNWRAAFWINLPLAALVLLLTLAFMPETRDHSVSGRPDWGGTLIAFLACGSLTLGLTWLTEAEGRLTLSLVLVGLGLAGLLAFFRFEANVKHPIAPTALFRSRAFTGTNLMTLLLYGALSGTMFLVPIDLIEYRGLTPTQVGLAMMPFGLIIGLLSSKAGKLGDRLGPRPMLLVGPTVVAAGVAGLALQLDNFWLGVELPLCIMALGMAIVVSPLTTTVMNSVSDARAGTASGINNTASRLAGLFAIAGAGACAARLFQTVNQSGQGQFGLFPDSDASSYEAIVSAYQLAYGGSLAMLAAGSLGAALIAAWLIPIKPGTKPEK
ncbi:MFS transporter [Saccharospirillum sp.]|uniref:MFS transporter n=1 Tax=Saccharospirillum sp. TaxID=2033801 RepID=UPI0034A012A9